MIYISLLVTLLKVLAFLFILFNRNEKTKHFLILSLLISAIFNTHVQSWLVWLDILTAWIFFNLQIKPKV